MLASSHSKKGASRMRPYLMISEMPDASSRSGKLSSVAMSMSTAQGNSTLPPLYQRVDVILRHRHQLA